MSTSPKSLPLGRRIVLQFVFTVVIVSIMLGGIAIGSFVTHFLWALQSDTPTRTAADAPAWLVIPSFAIGIGFFVLVNRYARLIERILRVCHR
jgi:hypothetical protein